MSANELVIQAVYIHPVYGAVKYVGWKIYNGNIEYEFWEEKNRLFHWINPNELTLIE